VKKHSSQSTLALTIAASLLLTSCTEVLYTSSTTSVTSSSTEKFVDAPVVQPRTYNIGSIDELDTFFDTLQYTQENWNNAGCKIPRIIFNRVGKNWVASSPQLPVNTKKSIFFRLMTPMILIANENILLEREIVENASLDATALLSIALKYKIINDADSPLTEIDRRHLLNRVDTLPASLALAQAAEESGWGTSRFALEGNAFFGQWDFSGNGMKPKQQRKELGNYGFARFDSAFDSVEAYMFNLNTNGAYRQLRQLRAEQRTNHNQVTGYQLATTLTKYSERGEAYSNGLRQMIRYNKLESIDDMLLSNDEEIHLISTAQ